MTDQEMSLVRACVADYDNDLPRLIYADWLEENALPEQAEFVRKQVESAKLPEWHADRQCCFSWLSRRSTRFLALDNSRSCSRRSRRFFFGGIIAHPASST